MRKIFQGIATSADKIYVLEVQNWGKKMLTCYSKSLEREIEIEAGLVKPFLMGKDVKRYRRPQPKNVVIFPYDLSKETPELMSQKYIKTNFPRGWDYLLENKSELSERESGRFKQTWWQFSRPQNLSEFTAVKVMMPDIAQCPQMSIDMSGTLYHTTTVYSFIFKREIRLKPKYFLGVLNSKLLWFFIYNTGNILSTVVV